MDEITCTRARWDALFGRLDALSDRLAQLNADLDAITECAALMEAGLSGADEFEGELRQTDYVA